MPSFDIVSKTDLAEVGNAIQNVMREVGQRFDFKGSKSRVDLADSVLTLMADDELKLKQMHELLQGHLQRRGVDIACLDYAEPERASGNMVRQLVSIREGLDREMASKITKAIKSSKMKVQAAVQGDEVRISGKKRDDLQSAMQLVKDLKIELPLQYVNFRD